MRFTCNACGLQVYLPANAGIFTSGFACRTSGGLNLVVLCRKAFDAKRRGRSTKQVKNHENLNYVNGGTQE